MNNNCAIEHFWFSQILPFISSAIQEHQLHSSSAGSIIALFSDPPLHDIRLEYLILLYTSCTCWLWLNVTHFHILSLSLPLFLRFTWLYHYYTTVGGSNSCWNTSLFYFLLLSFLLITLKHRVSSSPSFISVPHMIMKRIMMINTILWPSGASVSIINTKSSRISFVEENMTWHDIQMVMMPLLRDINTWEYTYDVCDDDDYWFTSTFLLLTQAGELKSSRNISIISWENLFINPPHITDYVKYSCSLSFILLSEKLLIKKYVHPNCDEI